MQLSLKYHLLWQNSGLVWAEEERRIHQLWPSSFLFVGLSFFCLFVFSWWPMTRLHYLFLYYLASALGALTALRSCCSQPSRRRGDSADHRGPIQQPGHHDRRRLQQTGWPGGLHPGGALRGRLSPGKRQQTIQFKPPHQKKQKQKKQRQLQLGRLPTSGPQLFAGLRSHESRAVTENKALFLGSEKKGGKKGKEIIQD